MRHTLNENLAREWFLFQSHAGSIEAVIAAEGVFDALARFNPTLVRLRQEVSMRPEHLLNLFQSHAGSIEARRPTPKPLASGRRFNPTLVRLRPRHREGARAETRVFQSHAGSIEASASLAQAIEDYKFQSHAGSIEASPYRLDALLNVDVSIPRWFD